MRVLSIQSAVAYGHVGNSAAVFPLQRLGHEVMPVYTVTFSNHTGYGAWRGRVASADEVRDVIAGVDDRGELANVDLVLSGYLGNPDIAGVIVDTVHRVKELNPAARYALDPVMGNADTGCVVDPAIPEIIRGSAAPVADIISPNQFELGFLTRTDPHTLDEILDSVARLQDLGPRIVLVTSVVRPGQPENTIEVIAADGADVWIASTPLLPLALSGTGDLITSLFVGQLANTGSVAEALARAVSGVFGVLGQTLDAGEREVQIVAAQLAFAEPACEFEVLKIR